jgi:putative AlgH/UPF0301 family transcriptional regulator
MSQQMEDTPTTIEPCSELGKGVVLLAQPSEFSHFLIRAAVLLFEYDPKTGAKGVILEKPTAFSMGEMSPTAGPFEPNVLFTGGEDGQDMAIMFHKYDLDGFAKYIGSGIYVGGLKQARELVESYKAKPRDFKFIFNYVMWGPAQLETELKNGRWNLAKIPPDMVLEQAGGVGSLWSKARRALNLNV